MLAVKGGGDGENQTQEAAAELQRYGNGYLRTWQTRWLHRFFFTLGLGILGKRSTASPNEAEIRVTALTFIASLL